MKGLSLSSFSQNFLGNAPEWYKLTIIGFLIFNPLLFDRLGTGTGVYFHPSYGAKMLPIAAWWATGHRSGGDGDDEPCYRLP